MSEKDHYDNAVCKKPLEPLSLNLRRENLNRKMVEKASYFFVKKNWKVRGKKSEKRNGY